MMISFGSVSFDLCLKQLLRWCFVAANLIVLLVSSHPQCLDSGPPFRPREKLEFCKSSSRLGCCSSQESKRLRGLYRDAKKLIPNLSERRKCRRYLSSVICLKCHSWAAHIFNAESNPNFQRKLALPCLNLKYCQNFVEKCASAIQYIWGDVFKAKNITLENFCQKNQIGANKDQCYPFIQKSLQQLNQGVVTRNNSFAEQKGCLCVKKIVGGLRSPLALVHANDQSHRMFVVEQVGIVYVILNRNGKKLKQPFLDITDRVYTTPYFGDERGLLGIAFHPSYRANGRVFVYYSTKNPRNVSQDARGTWWKINPSGSTVLSEFRVSGKNPNLIDVTSEKIILRIEQPLPNHNGGQLLFGDDGMLYVFLGDGGGAGDPFGSYGNALNKSTLLGKVLRIDINTRNGKPYEIPTDNPFLNESTTRPEIFAYGARNMWRCSVDRGVRSSGYGKGRIFCGDVGQNLYEEIDIIKKGGNYGWRGREGYLCYDPSLCNSSLLANEVFPIHAYSHMVGQSVVGGYVYRGCAYPKMRGLYFFADTMNGRIFTLKENRKTGEWQPREVCMGDGNYCNGLKVSGSYARNIFSFGEDEAGELYFLSTQSLRNQQRRGAVYQLIDPERRSDPTTCKYKVRKPVRLCVRQSKLMGRNVCSL